MLTITFMAPLRSNDEPESSHKKEFDQSALSGRLTLAQRFIAGKPMGFATKSVKRTTEKSCYAVRPFSRPLHGLRFNFALIPAVNCWAIVIRPLRGLADLLFVQGLSAPFSVMSKWKCYPKPVKHFLMVWRFTNRVPTKPTASPTASR